MPIPRKAAYRIAHFGDLHLESHKGKFRDEGEFPHAIAMVDHAIQNGADHFVFSGDILDAADADVLNAFVGELLARKLADADAVTVVPGNHDVFPLGWPLQVSDLWRTITRTAHSNFEHFAQATAWSRRGKMAGELFSNAPYPFAKSLRDDVVLVGLDTTINDKNLPTSWATGELSEEDADAAKEFFRQHRKAVHRIVVMHHYPFADFKDVNPMINMKFVKPDPATVRNWLGRTDATLVLCGHIHDNRDKQAAEGFRVICTDSVNPYIRKGDDHELRCYRLIELHTTGGVTVSDQFVGSA